VLDFSDKLFYTVLRKPNLIPAATRRVWVSCKGCTLDPLARISKAKTLICISSFFQCIREKEMAKPVRKKSGKSNSIWLTNDEHQHFKKIAEQNGTSISSAIKYAALNRELNVSHKTIKKADPKLLFEFNKIGCNINQIARQLNRMSKIDNFNSNDTKMIFNNFNIAIADLKSELLRVAKQ